MLRVALILVATTMASPVLALEKFICEGEIGNAYLPENVRYKTFGTRTFLIGLECSWWQRHMSKEQDCYYFFNGSRHKGYYYSNGDVSLEHLGSMAYFNSKAGTLSFKMSESTDGISGNEGQRWFSGRCKPED